MTGMLASVMSLSEARLALREKVDIIDMKNPHAGALGALPTETIAEIVTAVKGTVPCSATIGDLSPDAPGLLENIRTIATTGVDMVKVGLFGAVPTPAFIHAVRTAVEENINVVIVLFAEDYYEHEVIQALYAIGIKGIMLDTRNKENKNTRDLLPDPILQEFVQQVRRCQLLCGLAGGLAVADISYLLPMQPDYLGFRGALCTENKRARELDSAKLKLIRSIIPMTKLSNSVGG